MYVDAISGDPVATITTASTGDFSKYTDTTENVVIPCGDHKIYLVMEQDSGKTYVEMWIISSLNMNRKMQ